MSGNDYRQSQRQILGRVSRAEFVGRSEELARIVAHPSRADGSGLLILMNPTAGVSELMRQSYDELFNRRSDVVPVYFAIHRSEATPVSVAIQFLNTFLLQFIAYRRNEPSLCHASLLLGDLLKLALPSDYEWIEELLAAYERGRFGKDDQALARFCLSAAQRVPPQNGRPFVMFDAVQLRSSVNSAWSLDSEIIKTLTRGRQSFAFAGLRRQVLNAAHNAGAAFENLELLRLEQLDASDAGRIAELSARRQNVVLNDETRDLLVQQFDCSPFLMTALLDAASEKNVSLTSYLACEELYVDELMGGHFHRHFTSLLEDIAPRAETRRELIRLVGESMNSGTTRSSSEALRKRLQLEPDELEQILQGLYVQELLNRHGTSVDVGNGPLVWSDFINVRRRLDINNEPRALVVADTIAEALKRAPHTMARIYRAGVRLPLRDLLAGFNSQLVPRVLFQYDKFKSVYRGLSPEETLEKLDTESDMIRLPQVFHTATCEAFRRGAIGEDEEASVVAHAFEGANYADENEIVWLVAHVESKLEVERGLTGVWCARLEAFARDLGFTRTRILLVSNEGFSEDACLLLESRNAFGASRQQMELLTSRLGELAPARPTEEPNEFVTILPMGNDNELIAANVVEQIARKANFPPEAINQVKTAIVEACINAAEHSLSPDRKIYQRFRVENDRLVVTISSRGVIPTKQRLSQNPKAAKEIESSEGRRGWGLKLIRSLMDEVEFEQVDDGTSLRMTKYLRNSST